MFFKKQKKKNPEQVPQCYNVSPKTEMNFNLQFTTTSINNKPPFNKIRNKIKAQDGKQWTVNKQKLHEQQHLRKTGGFFLFVFGFKLLFICEPILGPLCGYRSGVTSSETILRLHLSRIWDKLCIFSVSFVFFFSYDDISSSATKLCWFNTFSWKKKKWRRRKNFKRA